MSKSVIRLQPKYVTWFLGFASVAAVTCIVIYPSQAFEASLRGLGLWWNLIFPALLPYMILSEIIIAYGFTRSFGRLLGPLPRLLFRLPSEAGAVMTAGLLTGSPAGAESAVKLRKAGKLTRIESQNIVAISHFSNPILMLTIIAAAFLHRPALGPFIAIVHYGSLFLCGLLARYALIGRLQADQAIPSAHPAPLEVYVSSLPTPVSPRSFGKIMGDGVADSLQKLMQIGGTVIIFSVALQLAAELGVSGTLVRIFKPLLSYFGISDATIVPVLAGMFEVHLGAFAIAQTALTATIPLEWAIALICAVLGWGGLAVHLQVRALLHETDIRYTPFLAARAAQAIVSFGLALLLWKPLEKWFAPARPSFQAVDGQKAGYAEMSFWPSYMPVRQVLFWVTLMLALLLVFALLKKR